MEVEMPKNVYGRKLEVRPETLEKMAFTRKLSARSNRDEEFFALVERATRELADWRKKFRLLEPFIQHKEDCPFIEDLMDGDKVVAKGNPVCICGLTELNPVG